MKDCLKGVHAHSPTASNPTATKQAQRTPGPWSMEYVPSKRRGLCIRSDAVNVDICQRISFEPNAAFIVRACNSHDDLLAALKAASPFVSAQAYSHPDARPTIDLIRAAIAKAEE